jgi:hypothetical protein
MVEQELTVVVPTTGEVISREDADACYRVLNEIRELESKLREAKGFLNEALAEKFSHEGTKTLELNGVTVELRGSSETVWDIEILEELRAAGLPEERMNQLLTEEVTTKVNASVAKQIAGANPTYAEIVERAKSVILKTGYAVERRGTK